MQYAALDCNLLSLLDISCFMSSSHNITVTTSEVLLDGAVGSCLNVRAAGQLGKMVADLLSELDL